MKRTQITQKGKTKGGIEMEFDVIEIKNIINAKLETKVDFRATEVEKIYVEEDEVKIFFRTTSNEIGNKASVTFKRKTEL